MLTRSLAFLALLGALASAQLIGPVGPTTSTKSKRQKICNVLDFGGEIGSSDIGPAIGTAFANCVLGNPGSTLYVPPGEYNMSTWQTLQNATKWALQMDGVITRNGPQGGHMIIIQNATDFEMYSSNSAGAFQGLGYLARNTGPRILRMVTSTNWSVHDLILVDSPEFHIVVQGGSNGELYNLAIRGTNLGGSDGIDISGVNHWVHDVEVSNRDECVTVKSPANHFLIERIWCNQSGGSAIGSLGGGTAVENIIYRNIYTNGGNQMMMIKSNGGSGYVRNVQFQHFLGRGSAYGLNVQQYWASITPREGPGVQLTNLTFSDWDGFVPDGVFRPPVQILCADGAPCTGIKLKRVNMWSATELAVNKCQSAYGTGGSCLEAEPEEPTATLTSYATITMTVSRPPRYTTPPSLQGDLTTGFATDSSIPIPTIPSTYFPGLPQISPLAKNKKKHCDPGHHGGHGGNGKGGKHPGRSADGKQPDHDKDDHCHD